MNFFSHPHTLFVSNIFYTKNTNTHKKGLPRSTQDTFGANTFPLVIPQNLPFIFHGSMGFCFTLHQHPTRSYSLHTALVTWRSGFDRSLLNRRSPHKARLRIGLHFLSIQVSRGSGGSKYLIMVLSSSVKDSKCSFGFNQKLGFHGYLQQAMFGWKQRSSSMSLLERHLGLGRFTIISERSIGNQCNQFLIIFALKLGFGIK